MSGEALKLDAKPDVKIVVHWLEKSRAQRILWLLEELQLPYELKPYKRSPEGTAPPELKQVHGMGHSPVITIQPADESLPPRTIAESGAIVEYLSEYFGPQLVPARWQEAKDNQIGGETEAWMRYRQLMHYAEGSLMPVLIVALIVNRIKDAPVPFFVKPVTRGIAGRIGSSFLEPKFQRHFEFLEEQISSSGGDYLCGNSLTGADIMMQFPMEACVSRAGLTKEKYPKLYEYADMLTQREAFKKAMERVKKETGKYESIADL